MFEDVYQALRDQLDTFAESFGKRLPSLVIVGVFLIVAALVARAVKASVARVVGMRARRRSVADLATKLTSIVVWTVAVLMAAAILFPSLTMGTVIGAVGLWSLAVGFAFKDIFESFFAGMLILWRFPFEPDDVIECQGIQFRGGSRTSPFA